MAKNIHLFNIKDDHSSSSRTEMAHKENVRSIFFSISSPTWTKMYNVSRSLLFLSVYNFKRNPRNFNCCEFEVSVPNLEPNQNAKSKAKNMELWRLYDAIMVKIMAQIRQINQTSDLIICSRNVRIQSHSIVNNCSIMLNCIIEQ